MGEAAVERLGAARVAVFGLGGVGGHVAEALARSGVGAIDLVDNDVVTQTNLNRQIVALKSTVGMRKTEVMKRRIADINPDCKTTVYDLFFDENTAKSFDFTVYDYVADAIDSVSGKLALAVCARDAGVPIISCMSAGNKLEPTMFEVADIFSTEVCPLCKVMRRELRARGIERLKVVYSRETPHAPTAQSTEEGNPRKVTIGSLATVPSVAGLIMANEIIKGLIGRE